MVAQFYATLYVDRPRRKFNWMLQGKRFSVTYNQFAIILCFLEANLQRPKIHDENVLEDGAMHYMYDRAYGKVVFGRLLDSHPTTSS